MKKTLLLSILLFGILTININAQSKSSTDKNKIILVNPGVFYLKSLVYMTDNGIIDIDNLEYQAVFYSKSEVSIDKAKKFIKDKQISYITVKEIEGNLTVDNLFKNNSCTASFAKLFSESDGVIFLGGWDIPAVTYGSKTSLYTQIKTPNRHYFELSFLYNLLGRGDNSSSFKPLLEDNPNYVVYGICLGMQTMSVATGGDMYQDIPSEVYGVKNVEDELALGTNKQHRSYWKNIDRDETLDGHSFHQIKLVENKFFVNIFDLDKKTTPYVCSSHHQAVKNVGYGFDVVATSIDGKIIEAIHHKKYKNVLGVQFHPEFYYLHNPDSKKFKIKPTDKELRTEHEIITELDGYQFNLQYWKYFSGLFD